MAKVTCFVLVVPQKGKKKEAPKKRCSTQERNSKKKNEKVM